MTTIPVTNSNRIIVEVQGGCVTNVNFNGENIKAVIVDWDNRGICNHCPVCDMPSFGDNDTCQTCGLPTSAVDEQDLLNAVDKMMSLPAEAFNING